ncbi:MAG: hypothetical protein HY062_08060, partial [Bacteroidetes bacterium]|nr:hypothetical protein [Bacteroidota bacterium]
ETIKELSRLRTELSAAREKYSDDHPDVVRLTKAIAAQEEALKQKLQTLPEEIVTTGITKIITGIISGDLFKSAISIIKTVGSVFSGHKEEHGSGSSIIDIIKNVVKNKLSH